ncbi:MAG: tetratricopeptide repeat protein [Halofilum sp. (in: g-proteobacteria)]|nr:tetratricopeptide repeat protein [Halofilum sp. (in: g-proteobacteria)]
MIALTDGGVDAGLSRITTIVSGGRDAEAALAAMERITADHDDRALAHYALAELASEVGQPQRALGALRRALELDPGYTDALVLRAEMQLEVGRAEAAFAGLREARRRHPDDRALALGLARLLVEAGRGEAARQEMQRAHERFGDAPEAVYSLALLAMQAEIWTDAKLYLERLVQMDARTSQAHYYLGRIAQQEGECTRALRHYIKVGQGEHRFDAELRAAICMAEVGRVEEARLHLERLRARYDAEGALAQIVMTHARVERMAGNPERTLEVLGRGVERFPDNTELRYSRALAAAEMDRFELARADLNAILERDPDNARALNALGYMLADRNTELRRARRMIERALEHNPDDAATVDSMGWVLYRLGQPRAALSHLRRAWELGRDAEIGAHLGEVLWSLGRRDEARRIWAQAREQAPDNAVLRETVERLAP